MINYAKDVILGTTIACFLAGVGLLIGEQLITDNVNFADMYLCLAIVCSMLTKGKQLLIELE